MTSVKETRDRHHPRTPRFVVERVQIDWELALSTHRARVCSVNYLNSVPLIWGMVEGPQSAEVDLSFALPSVCAEVIERGEADVGLVPVTEIARQGLEIVPGVGICCAGAVRSILLVSRVPVRSIRSLSVDSSSRTSVQLAKVVLREHYGVEPQLFAHRPALDEMLAVTDAALVIGDPALLIDPVNAGSECLDLGAEWFLLTGLPMVFAAWAGKPGQHISRLELTLTESYAFGAVHLDQIVKQEYGQRGITQDLARRYLRDNIHFELGSAERLGPQTFLSLAGLSIEAEFLISQ